MNPASALPPIKGFLETSLIDWPGCVCAVVFLPYCNLRCPYCHNHQLVLKPDTLETLPLDVVLDRVTSQDKWIDGICVTGGEPTIHRGLPIILEKIHEAGLNVKLDTNGTQPEILQHVISHKLVDHLAMDIKGPLDDITYARNAGVFVPAGFIKESVKVIMRSGIPHTFRTTVVPKLLSKIDIYNLAKGLKNLALECNTTTSPSLIIQNFNPADPLEPACKDIKPYNEKALDNIQTEVNNILG